MLLLHNVDQAALRQVAPEMSFRGIRRSLLSLPLQVLHRALGQVVLLRLLLLRALDRTHLLQMLALY